MDDIVLPDNELNLLAKHEGHEIYITTLSGSFSAPGIEFICGDCRTSLLGFSPDM